MAFSFQSIVSYQQALAQGATTCTQAVQHYLKAIEESSRLNAFTAVFAEGALAQALQLDEVRAQGLPMRPLHGVVLAVKDVICYQNHPTTAASAMLRGFEPVYNATAVQRLLQAGAIIIGMCNCDEFAMGSTNENSAYGPVLNAADETRVPGGSSGGSAVAVQAGLCMASLGSDTGGSVRQPADFCGVVGFKPTYGRISRYGLIAYASSFDSIGIFATSVADVAEIYCVVAGFDPLDSTSSSSHPVEAVQDLKQENSGPFRFAYLEPSVALPGLDSEIKQAFTGLCAYLPQHGHKVEAVPFSLLDYLVPAYYVLTTAEASSNLSRYDGVRYGHQIPEAGVDLTNFYKRSRSQGFGAEVKRRIMLGSFVLSAGYYDAYFAKAQQVRRLIIEETQAIFGQYDAILMPVSPSTAFKLGEKIDDPVAMYLADIYTVFSNLAGIPGMALPLFTHSNGMPFGVQVLTNRWEELTLHRISHYLMQCKGIYAR
jgi:aspartyl-tRNA(Asn)/glutamyl-tRNA(Gln) amidotransferase subunit A